MKPQSKRLANAPSFRMQISAVTSTAVKPRSNNAIADLIDAIYKKKGFKQLAGYSIKCLQGLLQPGRMGWEIQSRTAFELRGPHAVLDVLLKYYTDAELLRFGIAALRSMVSAPGVGVLDSESMALSVELVRALLRGDMSEGDTASTLAEALDYVLVVTRRSGGAIGETDVLSLLQVICTKIAGGWGGEAMPALSASVFRVVYALTLSRDGLALVSRRSPLLAAVTEAALHVFYVCAATPGGGYVLRTSLDPVLRLVDKLSRVPEGAGVLREVDALVALLPLIDWYLHAAPSEPPAAAANASAMTAMRRADSGAEGRGGAAAAAGASGGSHSSLSAAVVLDLANRLVGGGEGVERLLRIAGGKEVPARAAIASVGAQKGAAGAAAAAKAAAKAAALGTRQQAARLLARVAELSERSAALTRDIDVLEAACIIIEECIRETDESGASAADLMVPLALLATLLRVAERGTTGVTAVIAAGMLPAALDVLTVSLGNASSVTSDSAAAAALRLLHLAMSIAGDWWLEADGVTLGSGSSSSGGTGAGGGAAGTVREFLMGYDAGEAGSPLSLKHRYGAQTAPPAPSASSLLRLLLAGVLSTAVGLGADTPSTSTLTASEAASTGAGADLPAHAARLSLSFYALNLLKEVVFSAKAAAAGTGGGASSSTSASSGLSLGALGAVVRPTAAALAAAAAVYVAAPPDAHTAAAGGGGAEAGFLSLAWLARGTATLAVQLCVALADGSANAATLLEAGAASSVVALLQGFPIGAGSLDGADGGAGPAARGSALVRKASGRNTNSMLRRQPSARGAGAASAAGRKGAASSSSSGSSSAATTMGGLWMFSVAAECPAWASLSVAKPTLLAADALYLTASLMAFLAAHASEPSDAARLLSPGVLGACAPLAAAADIERPSTGHAAADAVQSAVSCMLQAALVTYALYPRDAGVYSNFREMVDVAGVSGEEVQAAVETVRGCAILLRVLMLEAAPTRASAVTGSNAAGAAIIKSWASAWEGSEMVALDAGDGEGARAAEAAVRARLPPGVTPTSDFMGCAWEVATLARQKLLLLEAISLSPFLSWGVIVANGALHVLRCVEALAGGVATFGDLDANRLSRCPSFGKPVRGRVPSLLTPALMARRLDDTLSHATAGLAHLARVAYEVRQSGAYAVDFEEADAIGIGRASGCDKRLVPETMYGLEVTRVMCACVPVILSASNVVPTPAFAAAATTMMSWMAAAATLQPLRSDPGLDPSWRPKYVQQLISAEFVEAGVALFRSALSELAASAAPSTASSSSSSHSSSHSSSAAGDVGSAEAASESAFDAVITLLTNLQYLAVASRAGAEAVVLRGATRQVLRAIPTLVAACGTDRGGLGYRALVAAIKLLSTCIATGGGGGEGSAGALLQKQGLVDVMVGVVFSGVGVTSGVAASAGGSGGAGGGFAVYGEACALAVSVVSAVATRKDVAAAVATLYDVCGAVSEAVNAYVDAAQGEAEAWMGVAAAGGAVPGLHLPKRSAVNFADLAAVAPAALGDAEGEGGDDDDDDEGGGGGGAASGGGNTGVLIGAVQLFALLISTDAGRRGGHELAAQGIAGCVAITQSAHTYVIMAARAQEAVMAAVSSVTAASLSAEGEGGGGSSAGASKGGSGLPTALSNAAAGALAPPPKGERDLAWAAPIGLMGARLALSSLLETTGTQPAGALLGGSVAERGDDAGWDADPVSVLSSAAGPMGEFTASALHSFLDVAVGMMDSGAYRGALGQLGAAANGSLVATVTGGRGKVGGGGASGATGAIPSVDLVLGEAAAALALGASSITWIAARVHASHEFRGLEVCLSALRGGHGAARGGEHGGSSGGSAASSASSSLRNLDGGGGGSGEGGGGERETSIDVVCHALTVLNGVAQCSSEQLAALASAGAAQAILGVLGDVLQAAAHAEAAGELVSEAHVSLLVSGIASGLHVLAALSTLGAAEAGEILGGGVVALLTSAAGLCGGGRDESGGAGGGGAGGASSSSSGALSHGGTASAASSAHGISGASAAPQRPVLLRSVCLTVTRLARHSGALASDDAPFVDASSAAAADGSSTSPSAAPHISLLARTVSQIGGGTALDDGSASLPLTLRTLLVRAVATACSGRAYLDSVPTYITLFNGILTLGGSPPPYPQIDPPLPPPSGQRTVTAILADAPRTLACTRRVMANSSATPLLLHLGRLVIALLGGGAGEEEAEAEDGDEVLAAVERAYSLLDVLHALYLEALSSGQGALDEAHWAPQIEEGLDALRTLNLVIQPHFPVRMEGESAADAASLAAAPKRRTAATVWQIFSTARDYTTAVSGCLGASRAAPSSPRLTALLYDVTSACLPIVSRLAVHAETARQGAVAAYWAGTASEWELDPEADAPLGEVVSTLGQSLQQHLGALQRSTAATSSSSAACPYAPAPVALDGVGKTIRNVVSGAGHEGLSALASAGAVDTMWRLAARLKAAAAGGGSGFAGSPDPAGAASEADRCVASLGSTLKFCVDKAAAELTLYCAAGAGDEPREVSSVLPPSALAEYLRGATLLAMMAGGGGDDSEEEEGGGSGAAAAEHHIPAPPHPRGHTGGAATPASSSSAALPHRGGADAVLRKLLSMIASAHGGEAALVGVLEEVGAGTLGSATLSGPLASTGGAAEARVSLKLYAGLLSALHERHAPSLSGPLPSLGASTGLLRGLYGGLIASLSVIVGEGFSAALRAATSTALFRDVAAEEHGGAPAFEDCDLQLWSAKPGARALAVGDARREEL